MRVRRATQQREKIRGAAALPGFARPVTDWSRPALIDFRALLRFLLSIELSLNGPFSVDQAAAVVQSLSLSLSLPRELTMSQLPAQQPNQLQNIRPLDKEFSNGFYPAICYS